VLPEVAQVTEGLCYTSDHFLVHWDSCGTAKVNPLEFCCRDLCDDNLIKVYASKIWKKNPIKYTEEAIKAGLDEMINCLGNYYNSIDTWEIQRAQVTFAKDLVLGFKSATVAAALMTAGVITT
jgi:hypothetical protein